eukprot:6492797-Amphidinium_carterae.1
MEKDVPAMTKRLDLAGWVSCFAPSPPNAQGKPRAGVAILARKGLQLEKTTFEPLDPYFDDGRVVTAWVLCNGTPVVHLAAIYAPTHPFTVDPEYDGMYWGAIQQWTSFHFGQQLCLAGDFNAEFSEFLEVDSVLAQGHMQSALHMFTQDRPATHSAGRAIDHVLVSENMVTSVVDAQTDLAWRFPNHRIVHVTLSIRVLIDGAPPDEGVYLNVPARLPISKAIAATLAELDWVHGKDEFHDAIDNVRIDDALAIWTERWESATLYSAALNDVETTPAMTGRALGETLTTPRSPQVPATSAHLPLQVRQLRRTWSLMKSWLLSQDKLSTFLELAKSKRKEAAILRRTLDLHEMRYEYISAVSIAQLRARMDAELDRLKRARVNAWKEQMSQISPACRFIRGSFITHSAVIEDTHGAVHVGYQAKSDVLRNFWQEACVPAPPHTTESVSAFVAKRLEKIPRGDHFVVPAFTGESVRQACRKTRKASAAGPGSWKVGELLQLSNIAFDELALLMTLIHETGRTPAAWQSSWVSFIPKTEGTIKVHQQRPITVTPLLWRVLARLINGALVDHLDQHLLKCQHGARPAHSCTEPALRIRAFGDLQRHYDKCGHLLQLDVAKCFNNLGTWDGLTIMEHYGLDSTTVRLLRNHYASCTMRNKLAPTWASQSYSTLRGCAQGCPISVTVANLILSLVPSVDESASKDVQTVMFLDDLSLYAEDKSQLVGNAAKACANIASLGLSIQPAKCVYAALGSNAATETPLVFDDMTFEACDRTQLLGMDVHSHHIDTPHHSQGVRANVAKQRTERCARVPGSRMHRQNLMALMVASLWRWAPLDPPVSKEYRTTMRRKAWAAVEGCDRPWEEAFEITMGVLLKGHVVDCAWAQSHAAVQMVWQVLHFCSDLGVTFETPVPLPGTMASELDRLIECVGLQRHGLVLSSALCDLTVHLRESLSSAQIGHDFRTLLRGHSFAALAVRRPKEFEHCDRGIHLEWVRKAAKASLTPVQATAFRKFCTGSFLCHEREARHSKSTAISPLCSLCGDLETMSHITYECSKLPVHHRQYLNKIQDKGARELLIRTGLPLDCPDIVHLGEKEYLHFTHHVSAALVRRNILTADAPAIHPVKRRLTFKQRRSWAYRVDGCYGGIPKTRKGPNLDQRADMEFALEPDGTWHVNGHRVRPCDTSCTPKLTCDLCCWTSAWVWKKIYYSKVCDMRPRRDKRCRLKLAGEHILQEKTVLTCMGCGGVGTTKHSAHFVKVHRTCEEVWRSCM